MGIQQLRSITTEPVDLLYILGTGSTWNNNEVRYSLRSVQAYLPHARVVVVGYRPWWMVNVHHIPAEDPFSDKQRNSIHKLRQAYLADPELDRAAIMNDDFFFLEPVKELKVYNRGTLREAIMEHPTKRGYYFDGLAWAETRLKRMGYEEPINFSVHYPLEVNATGVDLVFSALKDAEGRGYPFRTMYGNLNGLQGEKIDQKAGRCPLKLLKWRPLDGVPFFSTDNRVVDDQRLKRFLAERFPTPSIYEREA